jgi:hypothetical protein
MFGGRKRDPWTVMYMSGASFKGLSHEIRTGVGKV